MGTEDWPSSREQLLKDIESFDMNGPAKEEEPVAPARFTPARTVTAEPVAAPPKKTPPPVAAAEPPPDTLRNDSSLLARLKQQAQSKREGEDRQNTLQYAQQKIISDALQQTFLYFNELTQQLNVIKPIYEKSYSFFGVVEFDNMNWEEGRADFRMQQIASENRFYEQVTLRYRLQAPKQFRVTRENPAMEKLHKALFDHSIVFKTDEERNERGHAERATFTFPCEIKAGLMLVGDPASGEMILRTRNIERFGAMEFRMSPERLDAESLDELTHLILGKPNRVAQLFRRIV